VQRRVSVVAPVASNAAASAAEAAASTTPIVFSIGGDPVELQIQPLVLAEIQTGADTRAS
jgi:hypothetical protein